MLYQSWKTTTPSLSLALPAPTQPCAWLPQFNDEPQGHLPRLLCWVTSDSFFSFHHPIIWHHILPALLPADLHGQSLHISFIRQQLHWSSDLAVLLNAASVLPPDPLFKIPDHWPLMILRIWLQLPFGSILQYSLSKLTSHLLATNKTSPHISTHAGHLCLPPHLHAYVPLLVFKIFFQCLLISEREEKKERKRET